LNKKYKNKKTASENTENPCEKKKPVKEMKKISKKKIKARNFDKRYVQNEQES